MSNEAKQRASVTFKIDEQTSFTVTWAEIIRAIMADPNRKRLVTIGKARQGETSQTIQLVPGAFMYVGNEPEILEAILAAMGFNESKKEDR